MKKRMSKETEKKEEKKEKSIRFTVDNKELFYMVEYPEAFEYFSIFNTLEGAVEAIKNDKKEFKWSDFRILSLSRGSKGLEVVQISWADVLEVMT